MDNDKVKDHVISLIRSALHLKPKPYYLSEELAEAFQVTRYTIQRAANKHKIGRISKRQSGGRGIRIFAPYDLLHLYRVVRSPATSDPVL